MDKFFLKNFKLKTFIIIIFSNFVESLFIKKELLESAIFNNLCDEAEINKARYRPDLSIALIIY